MRQGDGRTQVVIRARERDSDTSRLTGVSMFIYVADDDRCELRAAIPRIRSGLCRALSAAKGRNSHLAIVTAVRRDRDRIAPRHRESRSPMPERHAPAGRLR